MIWAKIKKFSVLSKLFLLKGSELLLFSGLFKVQTAKGRQRGGGGYFSVGDVVG